MSPTPSTSRRLAAHAPPLAAAPSRSPPASACGGFARPFAEPPCCRFGKLAGEVASRVVRSRLCALHRWVELCPDAALQWVFTHAHEEIRTAMMAAAPDLLHLQRGARRPRRLCLASHPRSLPSLALPPPANPPSALCAQATAPTSSSSG